MSGHVLSNRIAKNEGSGINVQISFTELLDKLADAVEGDLPDECQALVEIKPLDRARDEEIARRHIELLRKAPNVGRLLYKKREEFYER